jgi:hypothetical protein
MCPWADAAVARWWGQREHAAAGFRALRALALAQGDDAVGVDGDDVDHPTERRVDFARDDAGASVCVARMRSNVSLTSSWNSVSFS